MSHDPAVLAHDNFTFHAGDGEATGCGREGAGPGPDPAPRAPRPAGPLPRVLWAEDGEDMREFVAGILSERFEVQAVADGQEALDAARANPPDVILSDIVMPRLDGVGLLRALREDPRLREIPVILLSARAGDEAGVEGIEEGADDYLMKPFRSRELLARVGAHARMARVRREANEAVRRSEERLRRRINVTGVGVLLFDEATGTLLGANDAFQEAFGYTRAEIEAGTLSCRVMTPPEYVAATEEQLARLAATGRIGPYEKEYLRKDGTRTWMVFAGASLGDGTFVEYCIDVNDRKRAEAALRQSEERLRAEIRERERAEAARTELLRKLATVQEDERRRVARDLHDSVGQLLAGLSLAIKAVSTTGPLPSASAEKLVDVQRVADLLGREVHGLAVRLRPTSLDEFGLPAALAQLVDEWTTKSGTTIDFQTTGLSAGRLPPEAETVLYRVVQEALTNVHRHARATQVSVVVSWLGATVTAVIEDDGVGIDPIAAGRGRLGLIGMRERVELAGGELELESVPGRGTTVAVRIPVPRATGGDA